MSAAERLRQAATLLRERADGAIEDLHGSRDWNGIGTGYRRPIHDHIALMSPTVALAVAAWLDDMAVGWNWDDDEREHFDADDNPLTLDESMDSHAVTLADAVLAEASR